VRLENWEVWFEGAVQGVAFRYTATRLAEHRPITGWIRNLSDGRVHMVIEGATEELRVFIHQLCDTTRGSVDDFHVKKSEATSEFDKFIVRY